MFWPEVDQEHARMDLRQALAFIRRVLGEDALINRGAEEVGVSPDRVWCDAAAFNDAVDQGKWAEAVEVYRGEFLKGFFLSNGPEFERWLDGERARLTSAYGSALERAADSATAEGNTRAALESSERLVEHDRYNSRHAMRLVEALVVAGDPGNALLCAERHAQLLRDELDAAPPAELQAPAERIRRESETLQPADQPLRADEMLTRPDTLAAPSGEVVPTRTVAVGTLRRRRWMAFAAVVAAVVAIAAVATVAIPNRGPQPVANRVAVVPFENRTGDASLDAMGNLVADWLTSGLTELPHLQVLRPDDVAQIVRSLAGEYSEGASRVGAERIGAATRAAVVITGSYYLHSEDLEFFSQVIDASAGGEVLFGVDPTSAPRADLQPALVALQEQLMGAVAVHLDLVEAGWGEPYAEPRRPPTIGAYQAYAEGRTAHRRVDLDESLRHHLRAVELDSTFVAAYASLVAGPLYALYERRAMDSVVQEVNRRVQNPTKLERVQLEFIRALTVADLPRVLVALRQYQVIAPSPATSIQFAMHAVEANRPREAIDFLELSRGWEEWFPSWWFLTAARHMLGDHGQELEDARRAREALPESMDIRFVEARALAALGDTSGVKRAVGEIAGGGEELHMLLRIAQELRAHGSPDLAGQVNERVVRWYEGILPDSIVTPRDRVQYAKALVAVGQLDTADSIVGLLVTEYPDHVAYRGYLGVIAARKGDEGGAWAIIRELSTWRQAYLYGNHHAWMARIAGVLGER